MNFQFQPVRFYCCVQLGVSLSTKVTRTLFFVILDQVRLLQVFPKPVTRDDLKACTDLRQMMAIRPGARLSIQPVTAAEWQIVHRLARVSDKP